MNIERPFAKNIAKIFANEKHHPAASWLTLQQLHFIFFSPLFLKLRFGGVYEAEERRADAARQTGGEEGECALSRARALVVDEDVHDRDLRG